MLLDESIVPVPLNQKYVRGWASVAQGTADGRRVDVTAVGKKTAGGETDDAGDSVRAVVTRRRSTRSGKTGPAGARHACEDDADHETAAAGAGYSGSDSFFATDCVGQRLDHGAGSAADCFDIRLPEATSDVGIETETNSHANATSSRSVNLTIGLRNRSHGYALMFSKLCTICSANISATFDSSSFFISATSASAR